MRKVDLHYAILDVDGPLFYIGHVGRSIQDGPKGVWIDVSAIPESPTIATAKVDGFRFTFKVVDPMRGISEDSMIASLRRLTPRSARGSKTFGHDEEIHIYAECIENSEEVQRLLDNSIESESDHIDLVTLVNNLVFNARTLSIKLFATLRRDYKQYWLLHTDDSFAWMHVSYWSDTLGSWMVINVDQEFREKILGDVPEMGSGYLIPKLLEKGTFINLDDVPAPGKPFTLPEEMIATAFIDLGKGRKRSGILHAIIALESSTNSCLTQLMTKQLPGLGQDRVVNVIARELSLDKLSELVYVLAIDPNGKGIDWASISELYNVRNQIIHRGRKKLPPESELVDLVIEVWKFVMAVDAVMITPNKR